MNETKKRIVVMGGSFNPPTIAHLRLMRAAVEGVNADTGVFLPASHTYVKIKMRRAKRPNEVYPEDVRMQMLEAMCADDPRFTTCDYELPYPQARNYETMVQLQEENPDAELYFLLGADKLEIFPRWRSGRAFMENFKLLVFQREGMNAEKQIMENERLREHRNAFVILPQPEGTEGVSSTAVREGMRSGKDVRQWLHEGVFKIMEEYRDAEQ